MVGLTSGGLLVDGGDGTCAQIIGIADATVDNTSGADGACQAPVRRGAHKFDNSGTNPVVQASMYLTTMKAEDNHTVCVAAGTGIAIKGPLPAAGHGRRLRRVLLSCARLASPSRLSGAQGVRTYQAALKGFLAMGAIINDPYLKQAST
jgi:hypothetical protein